jgi:hypothetical protein
VPLPERELIVEMEVDEPPRLMIKTEIVLDSGIGAQWRSHKAPEAGVGKNALQIPRPTPINQDVEVGKPINCGAHMLVAFPMTIREIGLMEPGEQVADDPKASRRDLRCGVFTLIRLCQV